MNNVEKILDDAGKRYVQRIRSNLASTGTDASGETSASVGYRVKGLTLEVFGGRAYFPTVETGSKKSTKKPSGEMLDSIARWMLIRGFPGNPWGVARNILRFGSKLWQRGGRKDIYTNVRMQSLEELPRMIAKAHKEEALKQFKK